ncbi:MAG: phosphatase PAP2 family protein [Candidatus Buchananbacteria bacterium]|nr:phosphatase PAP2 family protein [Candidatus Buchananbacteria bacterium]
MLNQVIIFCAQYLYIAIAGIALLFWIFKESTIKRNILGIGIPSLVIAVAADKILNLLIESPRPFLTEGVTPLFPHVTSNGFPSEHVLFATLIAATIFIYNKKLGSFVMVLAIVVGAARVMANVHHVMDVFGGLSIGIASVGIGCFIFSRYLQRLSFFTVRSK